MSNNRPGNNPAPPATNDFAYTMANLPLAHHFMSLSDQTGNGPGQPARNANLPEFNSTLLVANKKFRPVIANPDHAMQECLGLMERYNAVPQVVATDIPDLRTDGQRWVERLYNAVYDFSQTSENPKSIHYMNLLKEDYYPEGIMHILLWYLLTTIVEAQKGNCLMKPWLSAEYPAYRNYPTFAARFKDVEYVLRTSKACCGSLYSVLDFAARMAWNPPRELNRKRRGKNRHAAEHVGGDTGEQQGPTPDSNIELENKASIKNSMFFDDNKVVGQGAVPDLSEEPNTTRLKRSSKRALVLKQLTEHKRRRRTVGADAAPLDKEEATSTGPTSMEPTSSTPAGGEEGGRVRFDPWGSSSPGAPSSSPFPIDPRLSQTPRVSPGRRAPRPMPASYYWAQAQYHGTQAGTSYPQMQATPWFVAPPSGAQPTASSATFDRANRDPQEDNSDDEGQGNNLYDNEGHSWSLNAFRRQD
ncbi:hypothetical protein EKO27_g10789 [Xylaria grammica]|uniref:Uncharacterized protein n=1 Tax=Xylaria grammica TaxID=363999 RepID=A0A439CQ74_9PEZI|nr:hypothetical protein EKO27_g10789 [Xylaria grammica]